MMISIKELRFPLLICVCSFSMTSQNQVFKSFSDSLFSINDRILAPRIPFSLSGSSWRYLPFTDSVNVIANFMKQHPELIVEIGSFTDTRGNKENNLKLSENRARHIREYLVQKRGIDSARVSSKGYGSDMLLVGEDEIRHARDRAAQERMHERNNRTELKIISVQTPGATKDQK